MSIAILNEIEQELEPMFHLLETRTNHANETTRISLRSDISFKDFKANFPKITKKQLIAFFDYCDEHQKETYYAVYNLMQED